MAFEKIVENNVEVGFYDPELLEVYTDEDWEYLDSVIKHDRDYEIAYVGMEQFLQH